MTGIETCGTGPYLICEPFPETHIKVNTSTGIAKVEQKGNVLTCLKVLFTSPDGKLPYVKPGDSVFVLAEMYVATWAKKVFEFEGKKFIRVPEDQVVLTRLGSPDAVLTQLLGKYIPNTTIPPPFPPPPGTEYEPMPFKIPETVPQGQPIEITCGKQV